MAQTNTTKNLVEVISTETIKPSSPTPPHLRKMKRSYLDAIPNAMYVPLVFFYENNNEARATITSQRLKQSLSHALTSFYPLAGRIQDSRIVDCNDSGVVFIDARVRAQLKDSIRDPRAEDLKHYVPSRVKDELFLVQINSFDCGGIAVGVSFSHQIADLASIMSFLKKWAAGPTENDEEGPSFDLENYFPGRELPPGFDGSNLDPFLSDEKFTTKRFVFDEEKLTALGKKTIRPEEGVKESARGANDERAGPTRVELVSAFIWQTVMRAESVKNHNGEKVAFTANHAVNLRPRKISRPPQLLENVFGNCLVTAFSVSDSDEELGELARKLRTAIRRIDDDYITEMENGDVYLKDMYEAIMSIAKGESKFVGFSSWCGFPVYEVDFGWGKPIWVSTAGLPLKNVAVLMNSRGGGGIEAWVNMEHDNIDFIEAELKLV